MLTPPTDRLHKFLAIAGVALVILGFTYPIQKFHEAEIQRIEAVARVRELHYSYGRYAEKVNEMIGIYNSAVSHGSDSEEMSKAIKRIIELNPDATNSGRETEEIIVESTKHFELAMHMETMRNIWFGVGLLCLIGGVTLSFIGFRQWLSQPQDQR